MHDVAKPRLVRIEFDGGNNYHQKKGPGIGYGSYAIDNEEPTRIRFKRRMTSNAAEIATMLTAVHEVAKRYGTGVRLHIVGDSSNALGWAKLAGKGRRRHPSAKSTDDWKLAIACCYELLPKFAGVTCQWQPRKKSVRRFGH